MPRPIQVVSLSTGLAKKLAMVGRVNYSLDEVMVPVVVAAETVGDSPFDGSATPATTSLVQAAGGAGVFSYAMVEPGQAKILVVEAIEVANRAGAAANIEVRAIGETALGTITTTGTGFLDELRLLERSAGASRRLSSTTRTATHNALVGRPIVRCFIPADTMHRFDFPRGFALYSDLLEGFAALAAVPGGANVEIRANFYCTEYDLRR